MQVYQVLIPSYLKFWHIKIGVKMFPVVCTVYAKIPDETYSPTRHYSCMLLLLTLEYFKNVRESAASMPQSSKQAPFTSEVEDLIPAIRTHVQKTVGQRSAENRGFSLCKLVRIVVIG